MKGKDTYWLFRVKRGEGGRKGGTNTLSRRGRRKLPMMPWMSQPRPQLLARFICVWRVFCQPARCVFDGNVPTVQAVTRSHFTKATVRPNRAVCESEQNEGHERFYVWCYIIWCYILKTPSGREALELICYALHGNMKKKLRGVCGGHTQRVWLSLLISHSTVNNPFGTWLQ